MIDSEFKSLVGFKKNYTYPGLTEKQLKDEFKSFFLDDESNNVFVDTCSLAELQDICWCYELYLSLYPDTDLRELGIGKYINEIEEYILLTTSDPIKDSSGNIVGVNEDIAAFFQVRNKDTDKKGLRQINITNKRDRLDPDNRPGNVAEKIFKKMINNADNTDKSAKVMVCKSRLRLLINKYNKSYSVQERLNLQDQLKQLVQEIEDSYRLNEKADIHIGERLQENEEDYDENAVVDTGYVPPIKETCTKEENDVAIRNRKQIVLDDKDDNER